MARILVVEDEPTIRRFVTQALANAGHEVVEAENGVMALRQLERGKFDVLVTDLVMPEMEGLQLLRTIRGRSSRPRTIVMSGGGRGSAESYLEMAEAFGADATITKPFARETLIELVRRVMNQVTGSEDRPSPTA